MKASNYALWALLCVLVILVLVLAALLLARGHKPLSGARAALGGTALLVAGRGRRGGARGGGLGDIWDAAALPPAVSAVPWNFPARQTAGNPNLTRDWDAIRAGYDTLHQALDAAYAADPALAVVKNVTWLPSFGALGTALGALEQMVDQYRVEPPTAATIRNAGLLKNTLVLATPPLGALRNLRARMTGATGLAPGNEQDAVVRGVDALLGHVSALAPPEPLPALPLISAGIREVSTAAAGATGARISGFHGPPTLANLRAVADEFVAYRNQWNTQRNGLAPGADPTGLDASISAIGDQLDAVIAVYDQPQSVASTDALLPAFQALGRAVAAVRPIAPLPMPRTLAGAVNAILPITPPPLGPPPPEVSGFDPVSPGLVNQHDAGTIVAVRATIAAVAALDAWYTAGNVRRDQGIRAALTATDRDVQALNQAAAILARVYTAPLTENSPAESAGAIRALLAATAAAAGDFAPAPAQTGAVTAAARRLAPVPARAVRPAEEGRPLTENQRLIHLREPASVEVDVVDTPAAARKAPGNVVLEARTPEELDAKIKALPEGTYHGVYGLVVDREGDRLALLRAVAINLLSRLPDRYRGKPADRKHGATGWLYNIVRLPSGEYYKQLRDYIRPELYDVSA